MTPSKEVHENRIAIARGASEMAAICERAGNRMAAECINSVLKSLHALADRAVDFLANMENTVSRHNAMMCNAGDDEELSFAGKLDDIGAALSCRKLANRTAMRSAVSDQHGHWLRVEAMRNADKEFIRKVANILETP